MEPTNARTKDRLPIEIARLELRCGFVASVVENDRGTNPMALIAVNGRHVRTGDAIVGETFVERFNAHGAPASRDKTANGITTHGARDPGPKREAVQKLGGTIKFTAADVDLAFSRLAKG